jgi:hypothetical protein
VSLQTSEYSFSNKGHDGEDEHDQTKGLMESGHRTTKAMWAHHRAVFLDRPQGFKASSSTRNVCVILNKEGECVNGINP